MAEKSEDRREEERVFTSLSVNLGDSWGTTRDVSTSGMYFETNAWLNLGSSISFNVDFVAPAGNMMLRCHGEIVRIETSGSRVGVAVKIVDSTIELV
jgi:acyl-coenzyme A thioesterase PaaI-like protein